MSVNQIEKPSTSSVFKRQFAVCAAFALLHGMLVTGLYLQDRTRERTLRNEQAKHRLKIVYELISGEFERIQEDTLFLANQMSVRQFLQGDKNRRADIEMEFINFVRRKKMYDQVRLLDLNGRETIRINLARGRVKSVARSDLQDKSDRYYFREAATLNADEVFVSDFDLNLEYGQIEKPLKPVIRFVTPIHDDGGSAKGYLVLNYLGARLLRELNDPTVPGLTMVLRHDGNYLRGLKPSDAWGWLLGHTHTFATQFPSEWERIDETEACHLTQNGIFANRRIPLGSNPSDDSQKLTNSNKDRNTIIVVSYLPREQAFAASKKLLNRLLLLSGFFFVPLAIFAYYWAQASLSRKLQAQQMAVSEKRLRELSSRLLRIQEDERRAISREIHDELGQQVTAINLDLKLADRNIDLGQARPHLKRAIHENEGLLQTLHAFATRVRPAVLDDLGLRDAVESHLWEFQERTNIEVEESLCFQSDEIADEIADNAYRLVQESLNNVAKHADASKVSVTMSIVNNGCSKHLCITIRDDGRGYCENENNRQRLGLVGMQERVDLLRGELLMDSDFDRGTNIEIRLPLCNPPAEEKNNQA